MTHVKFRRYGAFLLSSLLLALLMFSMLPAGQAFAHTGQSVQHTSSDADGTTLKAYYDWIAQTFPDSGTACLVEAPRGVVAAGKFVGHTGWAFKQDNGDWTFGATENVGGHAFVGKGQNTDSWSNHGSWSDAVSMFNSERQGDAPYTEYRCVLFTHTNLAAAQNQIQVEGDNGYNVFTNNCLTKAVDILSAFGAPLQPGVNDRFASPNAYFHFFKENTPDTTYTDIYTFGGNEPFLPNLQLTAIWGPCPTVLLQGIGIIKNEEGMCPRQQTVPPQAPSRLQQAGTYTPPSSSTMVVPKVKTVFGLK